MYDIKTNKIYAIIGALLFFAFAVVGCEEYDAQPVANSKAVEEGNRLNLEANKMLKARDFDAAIALYSKAEEIFKNENRKDRELVAIYNIGLTLFKQNKYNEGLKYFFKAKELNELFGAEDKKMKLKYLCNAQISEIYMLLYQPKTSLEYRLKALSVAEKMKKQNFIFESKIKMGVIYRELGDYEKSLDVLEEVYGKTEEKNEEAYQQTCLLEMGATCFDAGDFNLAVIYFRKALDLAEKLDNQTKIALAKANLGLTYANLRDNRRYEMLFAAREYFEKIGDQDYLSFCDYGISIALFLDGKYKESIERLDMCIDYYKREKIQMRINDVYELYAKNYEALGDKENAIKYLQMNVKALGDNKREKIGDVADALFSKYEAEKSVAENQRRAELLKEKIANQKTVIYASLVFALFLIIALFTALFYQRKLRAKNREIAELSEIKEESYSLLSQEIRETVSQAVLKSKFLYDDDLKIYMNSFFKRISRLLNEIMSLNTRNEKIKKVREVENIHRN